MVWLGNDILAVATSTGCIRLLKYDVHDGELREEMYQPCGDGVSDAVVLKTGHVLTVNSECACVFNPLLTTEPIKISLKPLPKGVRTGKIQCSSDFLLVATSDGGLVNIPLPPLEKLDLSLMTLISSADDILPDASRVTRGISGNARDLGIGARSPALLGEVGAADGATSSDLNRVKFTYSVQKQALALINGSCELIVLTRQDGATSFTRVLKSGLPESKCIFLSWETVTESNLAFALRGNGVGLWQFGPDTEINMWSGMAYRNNLLSFSKENKSFDPLWARWSKAGQLALGLADGNFAVWDSVSAAISVSQKAGRHKHGITAGAWLASLFSPALALASTSTIKVSQGFEGAEWGSTAMKLKLPKKSAPSPGSRSRAPSVRKLASGLRGRADPEGLHFFALSFAPSGKYLAAIAAPTANLEQKQVVVYELQDQRETLVAVYEEEMDTEGSPLLLEWIQDESLFVVFTTADAGAIKMIAPSKYRGSRRVWPSTTSPAPGRIVDASILANGLMAVAFDTGGGAGTLLLLSAPRMTVVAEMPTRAPLNVTLYGPAPDGSAVLGMSFIAGGVEVWQV
mmetsp:Transcript_15229/g.34989  ORF Transcript_15229/g.34989 Transcript_15229/m.34989 type:complete len:573 (-) Transcript_15229:171-1889(-)